MRLNTFFARVGRDAVSATLSETLKARSRDPITPPPTLREEHAKDGAPAFPQPRPDASGPPDGRMRPSLRGHLAG
jgi:hypothetical protein